MDIENYEGAKASSRPTRDILLIVNKDKAKIDKAKPPSRRTRTRRRSPPPPRSTRPIRPRAPVASAPE
jgi:hypothetical protein